MQAHRLALAEMSNTAYNASDLRSATKLPRITPRRGLRSTSSNPNLTPRRVLVQKPSRLDLLDQNLTFFPNMDYTLEIIDDYFPVKPSPIVNLSPPRHSWAYAVHKKFRWRWRLNGLFHT